MAEPAASSNNWAVWLQAISLAIAALSAAYGFNSWRRQLIGGKKAEVAEKLLVSFYEVRDVIDAARHDPFRFDPERHRFAFQGEGKERTRHPADDPEKDLTNSYWAPAERLYKAEIFSTLNASRYQAIAFFGEQVSVPFETVRIVRERIIVSAQMLVTRLHRNYFDSEEGARKKQLWERNIWLTEPKPTK
jgi:hypothetical protein